MLTKVQANIMRIISEYPKLILHESINQQEIADMLSITRQAVRHHVEILADNGYIDIKKINHQKHNMSIKNTSWNKELIKGADKKFNKADKAKKEYRKSCKK